MSFSTSDPELHPAKQYASDEKLFDCAELEVHKSAYLCSKMTAYDTNVFEYKAAQSFHTSQ